jgi:S-DNA-T family DNA segregation ATPase FtsK/SpoIIIE
MQEKVAQINKLFDVMKIRAHVSSFKEGLRTCQYHIDLGLGEKVSKIRALDEELSLLVRSLSTPQITLDSKLGKVVIETTTTDEPISIPFTSLLHKAQLNNYILPLLVGSDMAGNPFTMELAECPHILIGGTTGSGKSILSQTMLESLIHRHDPQDLQLGLIDPKGTELTKYKESPYCAIYASNHDSITDTIYKAVDVMEDRYKLLSSKGMSSIHELRKTEKHPYIVLMIDELADILIQDKKEHLYTGLIRLLQKSRAAGIYIIANTQRPSKDVVTGLMKSVMPTRVALKVASHYDSRIIIDETGAENLVGKGDMLIKYNGKTTRVQGAII